MERLKEAMNTTKELWQGVPRGVKIAAALALALIFLATSAIFYNAGVSRNLSRELIAEKAAADAEYTDLASRVDEQRAKLDELNSQIGEAETKMEEYRQSKESYETELAELKSRVEEARTSSAQTSENSENSGNSGNSEKSKPPLSDSSVVYVTKTGKKYHRDGCASLSKSKIAMTLSEALAKGYSPCQNCN